MPRSKAGPHLPRLIDPRAPGRMVLVVPEGAADDHTRQPKFYDSTYEYLRGIGFQEL